MEAFHYLFHPVTRRLRQLLGELRHVETVTNIPARPPRTRDGRCRWPVER